MSDAELTVLSVLVQRETAHFQASFQQYGEMQFDPATPAAVALNAELVRRGISK